MNPTYTARLQQIIDRLFAKLRQMFTTKKTVDGIVASINKQVEHLIATADRARTSAINAYAEADAVEARANALVDEATRAARIAAKLKHLVA